MPLNFDDLEVVSDGEPPIANWQVSSSSEEESADEGEDTDSQTSEGCVCRQDDQTIGLEDIKALFIEDKELSVNTVEVSNCNSTFYVIEIFPSLNQSLLSTL